MATDIEKRNMELVGRHDLQGRSAYQPLVHAQGARWIEPRPEDHARRAVAELVGAVPVQRFVEVTRQCGPRYRIGNATTDR
jgi:hypothetical protein